MNWAAHVVTEKTSETEPTIVITFDGAKYCFNAGENLSRAVIQNKRGWRKLKAVFLTQVHTRTASGLAGMLMSVADQTARAMDVVAPRGALHLIASMRPYTFRASLALQVTELPDITVKGVDPEPAYQDERINVFAFPVKPNFSPTTILKRKRSLSPDTSSKRLATDTADASEDTLPKAAAWMDAGNDMFASAASFTDVKARSLHADDELRRMTVDGIFTGKRKRPTGVNSNDALADSDARQVPYWAEGAPENARQNRRSRDEPAMSWKQLPQFKCDDPMRTMAYVVVGHPARGKFDAARARALGLEGKDRSRVASGQTVTIRVDDGNGGTIERTIRPEDVLSPSFPPGVTMILDVPTPEHIDSLVAGFSEPFYSSFRSRTEEDIKKYNVRAVFHILGAGVLDDPRYQEFVRGFADRTNHFFSAPGFSPDPVVFTSAAFSQLRLGKIDADMFPLPKFSLTPVKSLSDLPNISLNMHLLRANVVIPIHPPDPPQPYTVVPDHFHPAIEQGDDWTPGYTAEMLDATKAVQGDFTERPRQAGDELVIVPLGTSSAVPSRYRNVSGVLLHDPSSGYVLIDPGEGTFGQLARFFGTDESEKDNVWNVLRQIKCIFVSHLHADHHAGLAKVLAMRRQLVPPSTEPLFLVANFRSHLYLREQSDLEDLGLVDSLEDHNLRVERGGYTGSVVPILNDALHYKTPKAASGNGWMDAASSRVSALALCAAMGLESVTTAYVNHGCNAHALIIASQNGWKFVYSGDTMPSDQLIEAGMDATLLIHEATMANDMAEMAEAKFHSTVGQAVDVARRMNARNLILTHFSARYPKLSGELFGDGKGPITAVAFDHARLRVGDLWKVPRYLSAIEKTVKETAEEGDADEEQQMLDASTNQ